MSELKKSKKRSDGCNPSNDRDLKDTLSLDAIYAELYTEMRRYRDQHFSLFQWYTTLSIAILAAIAGFGQLKNMQHFLIQVRPWLSVTLLIAASIVFFWIWYSNKRYDQLRDIVTDLEPKWMVDHLQTPTRIQPHHGLLTMTVVLTVTILIFLWGL